MAAAVDFVVKYGLENRDLAGITRIAPDELSSRRTHRYLTNVYDLKAKTLIWSSEGRSEETRREAFDFFGEEGARHFQGICCDI